MTTCQDSEIGLVAIERELAARSGRRRFPAAMERAFREETGPGRARHMTILAFVAIALYDAFAVNDYVSLSDRFGTMLICRFGIFTMLALVLIGVGYRHRSAVFLERSSVFMGALGVLMPGCVMIYSSSTHKLSYQFGSILVMMFTTVIQRIYFNPTIVAVVAIMSIELVATWLSKPFDPANYVAVCTIFAAAATLQLIAAHFTEQSDRRAFLLRLQSRALRAQLSASARIDMLTGLHNRRYLDEFGREIWAQDSARPIAAILLDVDRFKLFNDSYGHLRGDECLQTLATCVLEAVASYGGTAFRFGGEEIIILLPGLGLAEAQEVAHAIRRRIKAAAIPHPALGDGATVTASFGASAACQAAVSLSDLIAAADSALYAAKRAGRDCVWPPRDDRELVRLPEAECA